MKNLHLLAAVSTAFVLAACGGSSSSSSSTSTSTGSTTTPSNIHIEAIVSHLTTYDNGSSSNGILFQLQDPTTIQSQDQVQFQLVYYTSAGARVVLPTDQWTSSDTSNSYGTLGYNNGSFQAANATTPSPLEVSVVYNNKVYSTAYDVLPRQVRIRGVLQSASNANTKIGGVEIDFYGFSDPSDDTPYAVQSGFQDASEAAAGTAGTYTEYVYPSTPNTASQFVLLGKTTTQSDGTFRASVPAGTYGFTLLNSSIPVGYQKNDAFKYLGQTWSSGASIYPGSFAPIPTPSPIVTPPTSPLPNPLPDPVPTSELPKLSNYLPNGEYFLANYSSTNPLTNGTIELIHD